MELKKTVKRIAALGAAGIMLGTTVLSAMAAANLSNYPTPFIKDGKFDGLIVVGKNAAAQDVIGAVDIGTSLQYGMKTTTSTSCGGNVVTIDNGWKIEGIGSEKFNYGEYIADVRSTPLDDEELPQILAEGRYKESKGENDNDVSYTQELYLYQDSLGAAFSNTFASFDQPDDNLDAADYLALDDGELVYSYKLEFDQGVDFLGEFTSEIDDDFVGSQIEIQGQLYTITDTKGTAGASPVLNELTLMAGDTLVWLMQDQPIKKTVSGVDHEIMVVDVNDDEDRCGVSVDGNMVWVDVGSKETINGVDIAVLDAVAVHAQLQDVDVCEINLGATEIKLIDGENMERDGKEVKEALVTFEQTLPLAPNNAAELDIIWIDFAPEDAIYLADNQSFIDPAFNQLKIVMAGVDTLREDIKLTRDSSSKATLSFTNNDGKAVELNAFIDTSTVGDDTIYWGKSEAKLMLLEGDTTDCDGATDAEDCKGVKLYAITSGDTAHVLEITSIDTTDDTINLKDLTYGRTFDDLTIADGVSTTLNIGSLGSIDLIVNYACAGAICIDADRLNDGIAPDTFAETNYGALIEIESIAIADLAGVPGGVASPVFTLVEADLDDTEIDAAGPMDVTGEMLYDSAADDEIEVSWSTTGVNANDEWVTVGLDKIYDKSGTSIDSTAHGTLVEYDSDDEKYVTIMYPQEEVEVNAFVAPVSAVVSYAGGDVETTTLEKLNIGSAVLDTEVSDVTNNNMIVVGGPCINKVAATIMGKADYACGAESGIPENKGLIKLFEQSTGKVAMLVAGWEAMDTRRAARVVAKYADFALTGSEVVVTGTSLTDIKVEAAQ